MSVGKHRESRDRPHIYGPLISTKVLRELNRERRVFSSNGAQRSEHSHAKRNNTLLSHTPSWALCIHAKSCPTLCDPMDCSPPGSSVHGILQAYSHLILCRPLLLPPIPPSIRVFSNESALLMRWPKYCQEKYQ